MLCGIKKIVESSTTVGFKPTVLSLTVSCTVPAGQRLFVAFYFTPVPFCTLVSMNSQFC